MPDGALEFLGRQRNGNRFLLVPVDHAGDHALAAQPPGRLRASFVSRFSYQGNGFGHGGPFKQAQKTKTEQRTARMAVPIACADEWIIISTESAGCKRGEDKRRLLTRRRARGPDPRGPNRARN